MAAKTKKNVISAELLVSTHTTTETALFLFKTRTGVIELHLPRAELADLAKAVGKMMAQPVGASKKAIESDGPTDPKEMNVSKEAEQLVISFTTNSGHPKTFRFDRQHGFHLARLLMESASTGIQPWGRGSK